MCVCVGGGSQGNIPPAAVVFSTRKLSQPGIHNGTVLFWSFSLYGQKRGPRHQLLTRPPVVFSPFVSPLFDLAQGGGRGGVATDKVVEL